MFTWTTGVNYSQVLSTFLINPCCIHMECNRHSSCLQLSITGGYMECCWHSWAVHVVYMECYRHYYCLQLSIKSGCLKCCWHSWAVHVVYKECCKQSCKHSSSMQLCQIWAHGMLLTLLSSPCCVHGMVQTLTLFTAVNQKWVQGMLSTFLISPCCVQLPIACCV